MQTGPLVSGAVVQPSFIYRNKYIIFLLFGILLVVLIVINFTVKPIFSIFQKAAPILTVLPDRQVAFTKFPPFPDLSGSFSTLPSDGYTLSADIYLPGTFEIGKIPRVLLYRSNKPVHLGVEDLSGMEIEPFPFLKLFPETNILIWADPVTNDIYVSAITQSMPNGIPTEVSSEPLENVPIQRPFRITIVFTKQFMEIYKDGTLSQTVPLNDHPVVVPPSSYFFPQVLPLSSSIYLANVSIYPSILTSRQILQEAKMISSANFFKSK
jgi:hypothetical protein